MSVFSLSFRLGDFYCSYHQVQVNNTGLKDDPYVFRIIDFQGISGHLWCSNDSTGSLT